MTYKRPNCKYLRWPTFHAGYTGKSGPEASFGCALHKKLIRNIKHCEDYSGDYTGPQEDKS